MPARVLLIDDDAHLVDLLGTYLRARGYLVDCCGDGEGGLLAQHREKYDVIILDVMLPGIDGLAVCRRIRESSTVPIVMLSARGEEADRIVGIDLGADDYLPKPFNPRELLARLAAILRRTRVGEVKAPVPLRVGPLEIDRAAREITVRGQRRELTGREYQLLLLLAERAGRVQTRDQLVDALKGEERADADRSIDMHISRIRQVIEDDPRHPCLIQTVRGAGYVLAVPPDRTDA
ncbi:MAG: response regulator transcription factor [Polyangia bacterium]